MPLIPAQTILLGPESNAKTDRTMIIHCMGCMRMMLATTKAVHDFTNFNDFNTILERLVTFNVTFKVIVCAKCERQYTNVSADPDTGIAKSLRFKSVITRIELEAWINYTAMKNILQQELVSTKVEYTNRSSAASILSEIVAIEFVTNMIKIDAQNERVSKAAYTELDMLKEPS